jgi:hypothetical protein
MMEGLLLTSQMIFKYENLDSCLKVLYIKALYVSPDRLTGQYWNRTKLLTLVSSILFSVLLLIGTAHTCPQMGGGMGPWNGGNPGLAPVL